MVETERGVILERYVSPHVHVEEAPAEQGIRPRAFDDYPGQDIVKENLKIYVYAAKQRQEALDHVLLHGPPGLGKTTLARILSHELAVPFYQTSGPSIDKPGDLAGILAGLEPHALLFIDEIHRLPIAVEEVLYSAMEDFAIDIMVGQGPTARSMKMPLHPFTLVGATTRLSLLSAPLLNRFGIQERLEFYDEDALAAILRRSARLLMMPIVEAGAVALARRSRGTPRVANRLLRRVRDFAGFHSVTNIDEAIVELTLNRLAIDQCGLDAADRRILAIIRDRYNGGPVGLETLAATLGEDKSTLEEVYEPYLLHQGYISRGPRGREITRLGEQHLTACESAPTDEHT